MGISSLVSVLAACCLWEGVASMPEPIHSTAVFSGKIYHKVQQPQACIRLLNSQQVVGCSAEEREMPLEVFNSSLDNLKGPRMLIMTESQLGDLPQLMSSPAADYVKGVLVQSGSSPRQNPAAHFPLADLAPYSQLGYQWNSVGQDLLSRAFPFSITQLDENVTRRALHGASRNELRAFTGPMHVATSNSRMQGRHSTPECIKAGTCLPLGGHSVWASLPKLPAGSPEAGPLPIILVLAGMDGGGLFHDLIEAADAPLSGLVAMLVAAQILANGTNAGQAFTHRVVFAALAGEPWGAMGSRKFIQELQHGGNSTKGLVADQIGQVIEVGPVGRVSAANPELFVHQQRGAPFGNASRIVQALRAASSAEVQVTPASVINPGIPPSSLMAWLKLNQSIAGAVLTEYDRAFTNPDIDTQHDTADALQPAGIVSAAIVVAQALAELARPVGSASLQVDTAAVQQTVASLLDCLIRKSPGLDCGLAKSFMANPGPPWTTHYIGVIRTVTCDEQDPEFKSEYAHFVWNHLARTVSSGPATLANGTQAPCDPFTRPCQEGAVCYGYRPDLPPGPGNGQCIWATARYVPSYSTRLSCKNCAQEDWDVLEQDEQVSLGFPPDPMWAESNWDNSIPSLQLFQREAVNFERWLLGAGVMLTLGSAAAIYSAQLAYARHCKQR